MRAKTVFSRWIKRAAICVALPAMLLGCAAQTLEQRAALHMESARAWNSFLDTLKPYPDPKLAAYVEGVLDRVAGPKAQKPKIQVMDTSYPYAYASRRGGIRITRGMLATFQDEAELAFVIGHELAHLQQSHHDSLPDIRSLNAKNPAEAFARISERSMAIEVKADLRAAFLLKEAGYDGAAAHRALSRLARGARSDADEYDMLFRTHPSSAERLAVLPPGEPGDVNADRFLKAIDGMPVSLPGTGLRVADGRVLTPYMGLSLPKPDGFLLSRPDSDTMVFNHARDKMVLVVAVYTAQPGSVEKALRGPIYDGNARSFLETFDGDVRLGDLQSVKTFRVATGVRGASGVARLRNTAPRAEIWMATVAAKEKWLTLNLLYPTSRTSAARDLIAEIEKGLTRASAPVAEPRIELKRYASGDRLERLAAGYGSGPEALARFRLMNGLHEGGTPKPGQLLKTIAFH